MINSSRYWTIWRLEAIEGGCIRTQGCKCNLAWEFFQQKFPQFAARKQLSNSQEGEIQSVLVSGLHTEVSSPEELNLRVLSGLCLRCYVSYDIHQSCCKLAKNYSSQEFSFKTLLQDLLPFTLTDRGDTLILLGANSKRHQEVNPDWTVGERRATGLALDILGSYKLDESSKSLKNWTHLLVRQNKDVKAVLLEYSIQISTPWSLLKKATPKQLETYPDRDCRIAQAFQAVYRRDRRKQAHCLGSCPEPSEGQLEEILALLKPQGIVLNSTQDFLNKLKNIADRLRQDEVWKRRKHPSHRQLSPLDNINPDTGNSHEHLTDPNSNLDSTWPEQQKFLEFLYQQLEPALKFGIRQGIEDRKLELTQSKSYAPFASQFTRGIGLLYLQNLSQRQITRELGISNQSKVSRIFAPKDLLFRVRDRTVEKLMGLVLEEVQTFSITRISPEKHYLDNLREQLESLVDSEFFNDATSEIMVGSHRSLKSTYARELRFYLRSQSQDKKND